MDKSTTEQKVTFKYCAPEAKSVFLAGSFNGWNVAANRMKKSKDGAWTSTVKLLPGEYEYLFIVDGEWKTDPTCELRYLNRYGGYNSLLIVK